MGSKCPTSGPATILVVEDNLPTLEFIGDLLKMHGYRVVTAANGREGVQKLDGEPIDLVVSDWNMPDLDGVGVLRHAKSHHPTVPVILVSASWDPAVKRNIHALNPAAVLDKPIDPDAFLAFIRRLLKA